MSEMTAMQYFKTKNRMTKGCKINCCDCSMSFQCNKIGISCKLFESKYPEMAIEIISEWAKENPVKTYKTILFEKFPKATLQYNGAYDLSAVPCVRNMFGMEYKCIKDCITCWNTECED